ncbi:PH domain-containing protein [uncultured Tenacibaculum sp.]|uniref:PH domain-containing protein n=1 Tax=uncultured Tenacibaculum sp. TaxID=174713 RepID=UPI0026094F68|nr:PH domain-containing protein [uncultured Tenacibaculum sp.]
MEDQFQNNEVNNFPDISSVTFTRIEKSYFKVALLSVFSYFLVIVPVLILFLEKVIRKKEPDFPFYLYILILLIIVVYMLNLILGFPKRQYVVRDKDLTYKSGFLTRKMVTVPFSRIQHVEIDEGMFSRLFKLATLSVYTAGDSSDDLEIKGLTKEKAIQIKEFISSKINE